MVFQLLWGLATIGNNGFQWLSTSGLMMEWLPTIVKVSSTELGFLSGTILFLSATDEYPLPNEKSLIFEPYF